MSENYEWKISASILSRKKCDIYRDTGVSKNQATSNIQFILCDLKIHVFIMLVFKKQKKI